jgi:hypothetical protein
MYDNGLRKEKPEPISWHRESRVYALAVLFAERAPFTLKRWSYETNKKI